LWEGLVTEKLKAWAENTCTYMIK